MWVAGTGLCRRAARDLPVTPCCTMWCNYC